MKNDNKNIGGRPPHYNTPEELDAAIEKYFDCTEVWTVCGLAYHLGFVSRQSIWDYEQREAFSYLIKRAKLRIASQFEGMLADPKRNHAGPIFWLKNDGWTDRVTVNGDESDPIRIKIVGAKIEKLDSGD